MYNFDENKVRQEHQNGVDIIPKVESIVEYFLYWYWRNGTLCKPNDAYFQAIRFYSSIVY